MHSPPPLLPHRESMPRSGLGLRVCNALRADKVAGQGVLSSEVIRRPIVSTEAGDSGGGSDEGGGGGVGEGEEGKRVWEGGEAEEVEGEEEGDWVDWEDKILEDTVPLVGFVRMVLHSGQYGSGDRLKPEHEKTIIEKLLPYHPEAGKKIGCGIDYITVGYHPDFKSSRCLFVVRKDGEMEDFSYWKCIKGLIRKKYPLHADSFILRHFRRHRRDDRR
ncbi:hypothetical protein MLD38_014211 [Melastoma candidum]|uniref:Uncharacterized protein n=1 Tax=Melastoma candidum TaxID=119954 RepID=A0ACB9RC08_9MYRT|nr:hypothetical protein MLD38_014211 [Melastoma candidum]